MEHTQETYMHTQMFVWWTSKCIKESFTDLSLCLMTSLVSGSSVTWQPFRTTDFNCNLQERQMKHCPAKLSKCAVNFYATCDIFPERYCCRKREKIIIYLLYVPKCRCQLCLTDYWCGYFFKCVRTDSERPSLRAFTPTSVAPLQLTSTRVTRSQRRPMSASIWSPWRPGPVQLVTLSSFK